MPAVPHLGKLFLFTTLSLTDLALTWFLLKQPGGGAYEWNPVASWWLARFGWWGLVHFKLGLLLLIVILTLTVSRRRPRAAGHVLAFACAALLVVLVHSGRLVPEVMAQADQDHQRELLRARLERECVPLCAYLSVLCELRKDLIQRRRSLAEAVEVLSSTERVHEPEWLRLTALRFPDCKGTEVLAALLIEEAVFSPDADPKELHPALDAEFRSCFGRPAPPLPRDGQENQDEPDFRTQARMDSRLAQH